MLQFLITQIGKLKAAVASLADGETVKSYTYEVKDGFSIESWGGVSVKSVGKLMIIDIGGLKIPSGGLVVDTEFIDITNFTGTMNSAHCLAWQSNSDKAGIVTIFENKLHIGRVASEAVCSFQIVTTIQ